jgi:hypothetical protein
MRHPGAEPVRSAPAFAHLRHRTAPSPAGGPLGRNGGGLGPGGRHSYSVVNEQAGPEAPASRADWQPDRPATSDVYGRTRQAVNFQAAEDKRGPAGLSRSLQNSEIIPETRGCETLGRSLRPYIIRKGLLHRLSGRGNEAERRRFGRRGDDVSLSTAMSPSPAQCQLPWANVTFPGALQGSPAQSNVPWPVAEFPTPLQSSLGRCRLPWLNANFPGTVQTRLGQCNVLQRNVRFPGEM